VVDAVAWLGNEPVFVQFHVFCQAWHFDGSADVLQIAGARLFRLEENTVAITFDGAPATIRRICGAEDRSPSSNARRFQGKTKIVFCARR